MLEFTVFGCRLFNQNLEESTQLGRLHYARRLSFSGNRKVYWGYDESIVSPVGDRRYRSNFLIDQRLQLESEMALRLLHEEPTWGLKQQETLRGIGEGDYVLLDGASLFGGKRGFHTSLYKEALRKKVNLLAVSKQSPCCVMRKDEILWHQQTSLHHILFEFIIQLKRQIWRSICMGICLL